MILSAEATIAKMLGRGQGFLPRPLWRRIQPQEIPGRVETGGSTEHKVSEGGKGFARLKGSEKGRCWWRAKFLGRVLQAGLEKSAGTEPPLCISAR